MGILLSTSANRVLAPINRISEVLFGLIMVLTFTGSLSIAEAGREVPAVAHEREDRNVPASMQALTLHRS